ncbi:MAG TPA: hypothetical protein ENJ57_03775 [Rhizobiales bacterium]|nr:hypothetical protein [Hyphomicrobiales bacterium]
MQKSALQRLRANPDDLLARPKEGQDVAEWLKENGETFGIPEKPEDYEIKRPEVWPEDAPWDDKLEAAAREAGHTLSLNNAQLQGMTDMMAAQRVEDVKSVEGEFSQSNAEMQTELQKDWGDQYNAKVAQAQQAASLVGEAAGMDDKQIQAVTDALKPKIGDALILKMFAAFGDMAGEDMGAALGGGKGFGTTPADARAELATMKAKGGDYYKAVEAANKGDRSELERMKPVIERLAKIAAQ